MNQGIAKAPQAGMTATAGFAETSIQTTGETLSTVLAARAKAEVEARFIMALERPRNWLTVREGLIKACERPGFAGSTDRNADKWGTAWYMKPIGRDGIQGFSIRFAEECIRHMRNIDIRTTVIWEDDLKRLIRVEVIDLETNIGFPNDIVVEKTVERKKLLKGEKCLGSRMNSYGEMVHKRAATDDEVLPKQNSLASKAIRNAVLRLVPGDIQAECRNRVLEIRRGRAANDPDGGKKRIADSFSRHGISPSEIAKYLGHTLDTCSQPEIDRLHELYQAIKNGEVTWVKVMADVEAERGEDAEKSPTDKMKDELKATAPKKRGKTKTKKPDLYDDLLAAAELEFGANGKEWVNHRREKLGFEEPLTDDQANQLLTELKKGG